MTPVYCRTCGTVLDGSEPYPGVHCWTCAEEGIR